jgi:hypothetical protein
MTPPVWRPARTEPYTSSKGNTMAKEELIDMMGIVNEVLPDTRFV